MRHHLVHASIGKEEGGVVKGNGGGRMNVDMFLFLEEVNEVLTNLIPCQAGIHGDSLGE